MEFLSIFTKNSNYEKIMQSKYNTNKILSSIPDNSYPIKCENGIFLGINKDNINKTNTEPNFIILTGDVTEEILSIAKESKIPIVEIKEE